MNLTTAADDINFTLSKKQYTAMMVLEEESTEELMYGGAKGGGKTVFGCIWSYTQAKKLIKEFDLQPQDDVRLIPVVGFMGRKQSVDFTETTLRTWKTVIPAEAYEWKKQEKLLIIERTVAIQYGGMDDSATVKKFNSGEYAFAFLDQAEELSEDEVGMVRGTFRLALGGAHPRYKLLLTANPALCWLKEEFVDKSTRKTGSKFIQALPSDNPFLPDSYVPQLQKAFGHKPELLRAYLLGLWDGLDGANVVISEKNVRANVCNTQHDLSVKKRITVCDVGGDEDGADETVIYDFENTRISAEEIYSHNSTMDTCGRIVAHAKKNKSNLICVDIVGIGKGCYDRLCEIYADDDAMTIFGYDGRVSAHDNITFANSRAEDWWLAGIDFFEKRCDIPNDPVLIKQLYTVTYHFRSGGTICIDDKQRIIRKALRGASPDRADTYVMGLAALRIAEPVYKVDAYMRESESDYPFNSMTV